MAPQLAGLIITGQETLAPVDFDRISHFATPIIMTKYDTYDAVIHLGHLVAKIDTANPKKIERARALFKEHVDIDRIIALMNSNEISARLIFDMMN